MIAPMGTVARPDFAAFVKAVRLLNSSLELDAVLRGLFAGIEELLHPSSWSLLLREDKGDALVFALARTPHGKRLVGRRLAAGEGIAGWVVKSERTLLIPDVRRDDRFSDRTDRAIGFETRSVIAVPLRTPERVIGVIELVNSLEEREFTDEDVALLEAFADLAAIAIQNARTHGELLKLARSDPLSGLLNSHAFLATVEEAVHRGERFAVIFSDMDRFKELVDRHGHVCGSAALAEVGRLYREALVEGEVGCRFGGDEFAFLLPGADAEKAERRCRELEGLLASRRFLVEEGIAARLDASFGWALFPEDAWTSRALLHVADARMYEVKRARRRARGRS